MLEALINLFESWGVKSAADQLKYLLIPGTIPFAIWETVYTTVLATVFAYVIGLPLGIILVVGEAGGIRPLPRALMKALNIIVNLLRSVPFTILMVVCFPLARLIVGTSIGTTASIVPLTLAAAPFVARVVESSLREMDRGVIEAAQAMGCSPWQIVTKVMLPECKPSLIGGFHHRHHHHPELRRHGRRHRRPAAWVPWRCCGAMAGRSGWSSTWPWCSW